MARWRMRLITKRGARRLLVLALLLAIGLCCAWWFMIRMPGRSFRGEPPPLSAQQRALADELHRDVDMLAGVIGPRNVLFEKGLRQAEAFLEQTLRNAGYEVSRQEYTVDGVRCANIEVEVRGATRPDEVIIVGAHYDSVEACPAANDNGSGVAATLALARRFAGRAGAGTSGMSAPPEASVPPKVPDRTVRFVLFVNEEPPHFKTPQMGSYVYAQRCRERNENIVGMLSLETIGCYSDAPGSQHYPITPIGWLYPDRGDFIGFVGNVSSRKLVRQAIGSFRRHAQFPSQGAALPGWITGVDWSDHWSFWEHGYPALMVTDTALFRYPHYHRLSDTPDKLDYERFARVVDGLEKVIDDLATSD